MSRTFDQWFHRNNYLLDDNMSPGDIHELYEDELCEYHEHLADMRREEEQADEDNE